MSKENNFIEAYQNSESVAENEQPAVTPEYYVAHYMEIMPRYIAKGRPTKDTLKTYHDRIAPFLEWCAGNQYQPLQLHDYELRQYFEPFVRRHKEATVTLTAMGIKTFYMVAKKLSLIKDNPMDYLRFVAVNNRDEQFKYFTVEQVGEILQAFIKEPDDFTRTRNTAILYLMSAEGLRTVEIQRMNDEDIDWETATIMVRGKGHQSIIYPSDKTMEVLRAYLLARPASKQEDGMTPTFVSNSNRRLYQRITRNGLRNIMNKALALCHYKETGISCMVFRQSCGTNLYAATKSLRVVQQTMRHRDLNTTKRYAKAQQRMTHRYTNLLDPMAAINKSKEN